MAKYASRPTYPINISGRYKVLPTLDPKAYKLIGSPMVRMRPTAETISNETNFAKTICVSVIGNVRKISIVFSLFSSARLRIASAGIKIMVIQGMIAKNCRILTVPIRKRSFTNKKLAKIPNTIRIINPNGLLKKCPSSFLIKDFIV